MTIISGKMRGRTTSFFVAKGFSSFQRATSTLNFGKDSALNFWQLFGESLSMNLARLVVDVFSIKKSELPPPCGAH